MPSHLLVGVGNRDRGDDGVGPAVVARAAGRLAGRVPPVHVVECADPTDLVELWDGAELAVVVDAVRSADGEAPGSVTVLRTDPGGPPLPGRPWGGAGSGGSHALGLAEAVALARVLGRLPGHLVVVGVVASGFRPGATLSPAVAAAVESAAGTACRLLGVGEAEGTGDTDGAPPPPWS